MKQITKILGRMEASLNGSLDGLELDNTDDVIEKSLVIEMVNDLKMLVNEAQAEVKNISSNPVLSNSLPPVCVCEGAFGENENCPSCFPVSIISGGNV